MSFNDYLYHSPLEDPFTKNVLHKNLIKKNSMKKKFSQEKKVQYSCELFRTYCLVKTLPEKSNGTKPR